MALLFMMKNIYALAFAGVLLFSPTFAADSPVEKTSVTPDTRGKEIRSLIDQERVAEASKVAHQWIHDEKKADQPWAYLAEIAHGKKQYKKAILLAGKALKQNAENGHAYYWRGRSYESQKNWLEAANEYRAALLANSKLFEATAGLNRVQTNLSLPGMDARQPEADGHP